MSDYLQYEPQQEQSVKKPCDFFWPLSMENANMYNM